MKKEIIIDGKQSDWYKKAVFVLKDGVKNPPLPYKLSTYADELIENYLKKTFNNKEHRTKDDIQRKIDIFFYCSIYGAIIAGILLGIRLFF